MPQFIGEFECKIDSKCRLVLPSKLRVQIPEAQAKCLILNRGLEKCLLLTTKDVWDKEISRYDEMEYLDPRVREFTRKLNNGASLVEIDSSSRILVPKKLLDYAGISTDVVVAGNNRRIEIWDSKEYEKQMNFTPEDLSKLGMSLVQAYQQRKE